REQAVLPFTALRARLGEAGGDHAQCAHVPLQRGLGGLDDEAGREADDGEVDLPVDLVDRPLRADAGDRLSLEVDGVGDALEIGLEDVAEELAADRAAAPGGA